MAEYYSIQIWCHHLLCARLPEEPMCHQDIIIKAVKVIKLVLQEDETMIGRVMGPMLAVAQYSTNLDDRHFVQSALSAHHLLKTCA